MQLPPDQSRYCPPNAGTLSGPRLSFALEEDTIYLFDNARGNLLQDSNSTVCHYRNGGNRSSHRTFSRINLPYLYCFWVQEAAQMLLRVKSSC